MALRVLLADESVTIKKVFQVALQDFHPEVTAVTIGSDVVTVAERVKPDIIFVDVLLQKKNGYDVCREIKSAAALAATPVVLIWSGFMELDKQKFQASGANDHLEKPFDAQRLRDVVTKLVAKAKSQPVAPFLTMPKLPEFDESRPAEQPASNNWSMESFEPPPLVLNDAPDEFASVSLSGRSSIRPPIHPATQAPAQVDESEDDGMWVQKTLTKPKAAAEPAPVDDGSFVELNLDETDDAPSASISTRTSSASSAPVAPAVAAPGGLTEKQLIEIIRGQAAEVIEKVVWQVLPEVATRIVERELARLLEERGFDRET